MSLRSPLGAVLGLGSARNGSAHWVGQRVTAVALVLLGVWFVASLACLGNASHAEVVGWLRSLGHATLTVLLVLVTAHHANLGLQVVIEDYIPATGTRVVVLVIVKFALAAAALLGVLAVLRIATGAGA